MQIVFGEKKNSFHELLNNSSVAFHYTLVRISNACNNLFINTSLCTHFLKQLLLLDCLSMSIAVLMSF